MDTSLIKAMLLAASLAPHSQAKGKAYEDLAKYLFEKISGCIVETDVTNIFGTEQIDLAVGNAGSPTGLYLFPRVFLIECKDWDKPVDSSTVGYFLNILFGRSVEVGVLIAANGITGDITNMTHAHALGMSASARGTKLVILTTDDIESLSTIESLVDLLHRRLLRAYATGSVGAP
jgi:hypothetical protein